METNEVGGVPTIIQEELSVQIPDEDIQFVGKLNNDQMSAYNTIMNVIHQNQSQFFVVDGLGGTSKTFLYRTIMVNLRCNSQIVLATISSGIAARLLPGGRTAHSRFGIPIDIEPISICKITKKCDLTKLIRITNAIIWDEVPMINRYCVKALDRSLQDIMNIDAPFGGKIMIMGEDFRQVLPVIEKGSIREMISACIVKSQLWATTKILHLRQNMRLIHDHEFTQFLMRIGDGNEPAKEDDMVKMPAEIVIPWEGESAIKKLIQHTFPQLENHGWDASYMVEKAILIPKNYDVHMLNDMIINKFPGDEHILLFLMRLRVILIIYINKNTYT
ncbi:uncharacterized protein LOC127078905 [Lathyrus oleraceus]|uniref:uncharacterized protein LOC127078905 n=1 Tax=Pisum sativum TaxID=3888 RepID=UPI0021D24F5A|nr:uncharacterized protein LOC127078905 [Pisum sativum]